MTKILILYENRDFIPIVFEQQFGKVGMDSFLLVEQLKTLELSDNGKYYSIDLVKCDEEKTDTLLLTNVDMVFYEASIEHNIQTILNSNKVPKDKIIAI